MNTLILISIIVLLIFMLIVQLWFANKNKIENYELSEDITRDIEVLNNQLDK